MIPAEHCYYLDQRRSVGIWLSIVKCRWWGFSSTGMFEPPSPSQRLIGTTAHTVPTTTICRRVRMCVPSALLTITQSIKGPTRHYKNQGGLVKPLLGINCCQAWLRICLNHSLLRPRLRSFSQLPNKEQSCALRWDAGYGHGRGIKVILNTTDKRSQSEDTSTGHQRASIGQQRQVLCTCAPRISTCE